MNERTPLKPSTIVYETTQEIIKVNAVKASGGSALVYEGQKIDKSTEKAGFCLVKEIIPNVPGVSREGNTVHVENGILYQKIIAAAKAEAENQSKLAGGETEARSDIMLRGTEYISPENSTTGNAYLILDAVKGETLESIIPKHPTVYEICGYIKKLLVAVNFINKQNFLHLDISPDNVFVAADTDSVRVIDYNSGCFKDEESGLYKSISSKPGYSAPEVYEGFSNSICPASDLYSVAACIYILIFGEKYKAISDNPRRQNSIIEHKVAKTLDNKISKPAQRLLTEILCKGLAYYASNRYQTAEEMLTQIEKLSELTASNVVFPLDFSSDYRSRIPEFCRERSALLAEMHEILENYSHLFIDGLDGCGKTTLAQMYVDKFSQEYDYIQFFEYSCFADIIIKIKFAGINEESEELYDKKVKYLENDTNSRTLLIIDNIIPVEDKDFEMFLNVPCKVIFILSGTLNERSSKMPYGIDNCDSYISLNRASGFENAFDYFVSVSERNEDEYEDIEKILGFVNDHLLLVRMSALLLKNFPDITAKSLLKKLQELEPFDSGVKSLGISGFIIGEFKQEAQKSVLRKLFEITPFSDEDIEILSAMTIVPDRGITLTSLIEIFGFTPYSIERLAEQGWIVKTNLEISLHTSIFDALCDFEKMKPDYTKLSALLEVIAENAGVESYKTDDSIYDIFGKIPFELKFIHRDQKIDEIFNWRQDNTNSAVFYEFKNLELLNVADKHSALILDALNGICHEAEISIFNNRTAVYEALKVWVDLETGESYNDCSLYASICQYSKLLFYFLEALEKCRKIYGEFHKYTLKNIAFVGCIYECMGLYENAAHYYDKYLTLSMLKKQRLEKDSDEFLLTANSIGCLWFSISEDNKAREYFRRALNISKNLYGETHRFTAICYNNIGCTETCVGEFKHALDDHYTPSLEIKSELPDKNPKSFAITYNNIGQMYKYMGKYSDAEKFLSEALRIKKSMQDKDAAASCYYNLADVFIRSESYDKALEYLNIALGIKASSPFASATCHNTIGFTLAKVEKYSEAVKHYNHAIEIYMSVYGKIHPDLAGFYDNLSKSYNWLDMYAEAEEAKEISRKIRSLTQWLYAED